MKIRVLIVILLALITLPSSMYAESVRAERRAINEGNRLVREGKLAEGIRLYKQALQANPESNVARFNLGLSQINLAKATQNNDSLSKRLITEGSRLMQSVAGPECQNIDLRSKANYNMGNLAFENEDYAGAINLYKQALRLNPDFPDARRNLRIAQLKLQNQDNNKDQNQQNRQDQQDQQDQQDKQDQQDRQDQQDKQDQNNQQDQQQQDQQPKDNEINQQAAEQILNAVENNENQTRARQAAQGNKSSGNHERVKKW